MGLAMPGQGVLQAPMLGFNLDCFQMLALDELGRNTVTPNNSCNAPPGRITPRKSGHTTPQEMGSAFMPGVGINPPHLPGNDFLHQGATAGINLGICSLDATTSCQQSNIAAGSVGDSVVFPTGIHTRNPNQVDVLHLMNQRMAEGMAHLNSMVPSKDGHCVVQLEGTISSALQHTAQKKS
jgi:hypothetical protein